MAKSNAAPITPDERVSLVIRRFIWLIVFPAALFLSGWSLYWLMRHWGAPRPVAIFASACTDGVAIYAADQCLSAINEGARGTWERFIVIAFALAGAWINRYHAIALGEPLPAQVGWAIPTLAAAVVYDLKHRSIRRKARAKIYRQTGDVYPDVITWFLFPLKSLAWSMDRAWARIPATMTRSQRKETPGRKVVYAQVRAGEVVNVPERIVVRPERIPEAAGQTERTEGTGERTAPVSERTAPAQPGTNVYPLSGRAAHAPHRHIRSWAKERGYLPESSVRGAIPAWIYEAHAQETAGTDNERTEGTV